jgi:phospholipid-binding lipoprotein MlaA
VRRLPALLSALVVASALGCASPQHPDPIEAQNRGVFGFNQQADRWVVRPVSQGWSFVTPEAGRRSIDKFFTNLRFPVRFVASLIQAEARGAGTELTRFVLNTTVGLAGFFDPAGHWGIEPRDEDFGLAFGRWGIESGAYLQLPLLGPSSSRDAVGTVFDTALDPVIWIGILLVPGFGALDLFNRRALADEDIEDLRAASLDFYVSVRNAFLQNRAARVRREAPPPPETEDDLYDFEDDEDAVDEEESADPAPAP